MNKHFKEQHLFEIDIFCNITNVFTVTFAQFNASSLKKTIHLFKNKKHIDPKPLSSIVSHSVKSV